MKIKDVIILVIKVAVSIWIWENYGLLNGFLGWLAMDLLITGVMLALYPKQREYLYNIFMGGVRAIELQLFGHTNDMGVKNERRKQVKKNGHKPEDH